VFRRINQVTRSLGYLQDVCQGCASRGREPSIEQPLDTSTAAEEGILDVLRVFAEFETNLRKKSQPEGTPKVKANGVAKGRKPSIVEESGRSRLKAWEPSRLLRHSRSDGFRISRSRLTATLSVFEDHVGKPNNE
jgi:DNA invertase Pin-like site-specific DNA recombinase